MGGQGEGASPFLGGGGCRNPGGNLVVTREVRSQRVPTSLALYVTYRCGVDESCAASLAKVAISSCTGLCKLGAW